MLDTDLLKDKELFDSLSSSYGLKFDLESENRLIAADICRNLKGSLLEVGCGNGLFLKLLGKRRGVVGVDYSSKMLSCAKKRLDSSVRLVEGSAQNLPFSNSEFDIVVCVNVLHNLPSLNADDSVFKEISRVLVCGGLFLFDFRNVKNPFIGIGYLRSRIKTGHYFLCYSFFRIKRILKRYGFEIVGVRPVFYGSMTKIPKNPVLRLFRQIMFFFYKQLTKSTFFSPYVFIEARKS